MTKYKKVIETKVLLDLIEKNYMDQIEEDPSTHPSYMIHTAKIEELLVEKPREFYVEMKDGDEVPEDIGVERSTFSTVPDHGYTIIKVREVLEDE